MIEDPPRPNPVFDLRDYESEDDVEKPYTQIINPQRDGKLFKSAAEGKTTIVTPADRAAARRRNFVLNLPDSILAVTTAAGIGQPTVSVQREPTPTTPPSEFRPRAD